MIVCPICRSSIQWSQTAREWQLQVCCPCGRLTYGSLSSGHRWMFTRARGEGQDWVVLVHFSWDGSARTTCSEDEIRAAVDDAVADEVLES